MRTHRLPARLVAAVSTIATVLAGAVLLTAAPAQAAGAETDYGFQSNAFGTRVTSNTIALNVSRSAFSWIGCTRRAGLNPTSLPTAGNVLAASASPRNPWVQLGAVTTANRTFRNKSTGVTGNQAVSRIASLTLTGPTPAEGVPGPSFELEGLTTKARTWAKAGKLYGSTSVSSVDLALRLPEGTPVDAPLRELLGAVDEGIGAVMGVLEQAQGNTVEVPGLGRVRLGRESVVIKRDLAQARARSLVVDLAGQDAQMGTVDDSRIVIGHSQSRISRNVPRALMGGHGYPLEMSVADDVLRVGKVGVQVLPCEGTNGEVLGEHLPAQDVLEGALAVGKLTSQAFGRHGSDGSGEAWTSGRVSRVALGQREQRVELAGIVGVARVRRKADGAIVRSTKGTTVGSFTIGGEEQELPADSGPVELPGLGTIEFNLVQRTLRGVQLTAVRITLHPGASGETVIDLGNARTSVR